MIITSDSQAEVHISEAPKKEVGFELSGMGAQIRSLEVTQQGESLWDIWKQGQREMSYTVNWRRHHAVWSL